MDQGGERLFVGGLPPRGAGYGKSPPGSRFIGFVSSLTVFGMTEGNAVARHSYDL